MTKKAAKTQGFSPKRKFSNDPVREVEGVWFDYEGGSRLLIARYGNPEHVKLERQLESKMAARLQSGDEHAKVDARMELNRKAFAQAVVKGWEGILDEDETELEYSPEAAEDLLRLPEFFGAVFEFAHTADEFRKHREAEAVKN